LKIFNYGCIISTKPLVEQVKEDEAKKAAAATSNTPPTSDTARTFSNIPTASQPRQQTIGTQGEYIDKYIDNKLLVLN
jgi:hypothetical protein